MAFIALKPCKFGGVQYRRGDNIPADMVLKDRVPCLVAIGMIAKVEDSQPNTKAAQPEAKAKQPEQEQAAKDNGKQPEAEATPKRTRAKTETKK